MKTPRHIIARVLADKSMDENLDMDAFSREVAAFLLINGRTGELSSLIRDIQELRAKRGYVEVIAASAHQLDEAAKQDITAEIRQLYPDAKNIRITEVRDPEILGGVKLITANQQLNASVRAKLDRFKQLTAVGA
jgi:F0F1-type ATP synthase delta subunit